MTYNLSEVRFVNDFYELETANGNSVVFNLLDEQISDGTLEVNINAINLAVIDSDGNYYDGVNIIGERGKFYALQTEHKEYLGLPLNKDNIQYCTLEVADD